MSVDFVLKGMSVDKLVDSLGEFVIHNISALLQEMGNLSMKLMDRVSSSDMSHVVDNVEDDLVAEVLFILIQVVVDCSSVSTGLESSADIIHVLLMPLECLLLLLMSDVLVDNLEHSVEMFVDWAGLDDLMESFNISENIEDQVSSGCPGFSAGIDGLEDTFKVAVEAGLSFDVLARNKLLVFGANIKFVGLFAPSEDLNDVSMLDNISPTDHVLEGCNIVINYLLFVDLDMSDKSQYGSDQSSFCLHVMLDALHKFMYNETSIIIVAVIVLDVRAIDRLSIQGAEM